MGKKFQKIQLEVTGSFVEDENHIANEIKEVSKIMEENFVEYDIQIEEDRYKGNDYHIVYLIVSKEDAEKVAALLDANGSFGYVMDLDETYELDSEGNEICIGPNGEIISTTAEENSNTKVENKEDVINNDVTSNEEEDLSGEMPRKKTGGIPLIVIIVIVLAFAYLLMNG